MQDGLMVVLYRATAQLRGTCHRVVKVLTGRVSVLITHNSPVSCGRVITCELLEWAGRVAGCCVRLS